MVARKNRTAGSSAALVAVVDTDNWGLALRRVELALADIPVAGADNDVDSCPVDLRRRVDLQTEDKLGQHMGLEREESFQAQHFRELAQRSKWAVLALVGLETLLETVDLIDCC